MARRLREFRTHITVGEYSFDMVINRDILQKSLSNHNGIWEFMQNNKDADKEDIENLAVGDIVAKALETQTFYDDLDDFIVDILPKMIATAEENGEKQFDGTVDEFLDYCDENGVLEDVEMQIFNFSMLGFTGGKGEAKQPKVKVEMK